MKGMPIRTVARKGVTYAMGRWVASVAGTSPQFDGMPKPQAPESDAPAHAATDYKWALWAHEQLFPLYQAYVAMPNAVEQVLEEERTLETRGYTGEALRDAMVIMADRGFAALKSGATKAFLVAKTIRTWTDALSVTFQEPGESEVRQATLDLALGERFIGLSPADRARWLVAGDDRSLAALVRLPGSLTTLKPDEMTLLRDTFMERRYPQTAAAFGQLLEVLDSPRMAAREGAKAVARAAGRDPDAEIRSWDDAGRWVVGPSARL